MSTKEQYWKYSLIAIIIGLGIILFRQIAPFMGGLLGALTIYILVRKQMMYLSDKRKMKRSIAATLITAEAILCFLVPLGLVVWLAVVSLQNINLDPQAIIAPFEEAANIIKAKTGYYILGKDTVAYVISILPRIGQAIMGGISSFAVNIFVLVFVLYFMLIGGKKMEQYVNDLLPFNDDNTQKRHPRNQHDCPLQCHRHPLTRRHTRRSSHDRLLDFRCSQHLVHRFPDLLRQHHPNGRNSAGMVSDSCLHGIDRQLGSSYRAGHLWRCSHFTARQPDTLHHPEENGRHSSAYHCLRSCNWLVPFRIHGCHLRATALITILSVRGYV